MLQTGGNDNRLKPVDLSMKVFNHLSRAMTALHNTKITRRIRAKVALSYNVMKLLTISEGTTTSFHPIKMMFLNTEIVRPYPPTNPPNTSHTIRLRSNGKIAIDREPNKRLTRRSSSPRPTSLNTTGTGLANSDR